MESFPPPLLPLLAAGVAAAAALILVAAAAAAAAWKHPRRQRRRYHPMAGTVFHQVLHFGRLYHYQTELSRRYKTFRLFAPFRGEIYTCDPAVVEHILRTNFANYGKGSFNHDTIRDLLGDGIFAVDGNKWRHQRKLASHEFSARALRDYSSVVFKKNAAKLAKGICEAVDAQQVIDIQDWFMKSTMDSIFEVAFGIELNCLDGSNEKGNQFVMAFDDSSMLLTWRFLNPFWKIMRLLNVGSEARLRQNIRVVDDYVFSLIHAKIEQIYTGRRRGDSSVEKEDILSRFLLESEKDPKNMSYQYLRDIILNFVIAGKDTTAGTLAWFFYMLCKHPSVQERVAEEVAEAVVGDGGSPSSFEEFAENITEEALAKMEYLHAALSETLRLYPAVPLAGPRICLGKEFAYRQMKIFAATLVYFFMFKLSDERKPVNYRTMLTLHIDQGLHLCAVLRRSR